MFEKTPINPELVQSIEQVYTLRNIAIQFFVDQRIQMLNVQTDVERARLIVALVDVLKRSDRLGKVLILSDLSKILDQIYRSFELHTQIELSFIGADQTLKDINFITYKGFFNIIGYDNQKNAEFFEQFDLIIVDNIDDEKNEIFRRKLNLYSNWLLKIDMPAIENLSFA